MDCKNEEDDQIAHDNGRATVLRAKMGIYAMFLLVSGNSVMAVKIVSDGDWEGLQCREQYNMVISATCGQPYEGTVICTMPVTERLGV
jgi:hypothetical protein